MQPSEARSAADLDLDLKPPVCLDAWALAVAAGIVAGMVLPPLGIALVVASLILALGATFWRGLVSPDWRLMAMLSPIFTVAGVGIAFLHLSTPDPLAELAAMEPGEVILAGEISSPPAQSSFGYRADVRVEHLWYEGEEILRGGGIEVFASDLSVGVGDEVRVDGEISVPEPSEDGFDYAKYLATKRISAVVDATNVVPLSEDGWIGRVHRRTDVALGYGLRPDEAAVVRGMVLGDRSRIPEELDEAFQRSGITHVLAISGQHVAILAAMIYFVLRGFAVPIRACVPVTLALIWLYILVAGAPPSAIRAGVVATLVLAARFFGLQVSPLHFMTTMLAAVLAYNPMLIYSTGFQLSVAAVFGILLLRKPLKSFVESTIFRPFKKPPDAVSNLLAISLAAQVATAPIIAASFGTVSLIGVLTNLVAVPLSGPILTLGLLGSIAGNILPLLAYPLNASNGFLVTLLAWIAQTASSMPFAALETSDVGLPMISMFYVGCAPAALAESLVPEERWPVWAGLLLLWVGGWLALVSLV